jgi:uroporphyrinogen decarboxylase
MLSRERVIKVIKHEKPDRIPIYGWVRANLAEQIAGEWGSVEAFEDAYEFDFAHLFGGPPVWDGGEVEALRAAKGDMEPRDLLAFELNDVNNSAAYDDLREQVRHHKEERGRFVYVQTPGLFEAMNGFFGIENHLMYLVLYEDELKQVYARQAEWNRQFAMNCLDIGIDMIHVSDDWGAQRGLLFSPELWWNLMYPYHKTTCDAVRQRGGFLSLHSDGNVMAVMDGVLQLGYQVVHPWQESAGMGLDTFKNQYRDRLTVMGGLDVQTTIGFGKLDFLQTEIRRIMEMFSDGGLLFCTSHYVQDHCSVEELKCAFDTAYRVARELS